MPPTSDFVPFGAPSCAAGRSRSFTVERASSEAGGSDSTTEYEAVERSGLSFGAETEPTPLTLPRSVRNAAARAALSGRSSSEER